MLNALPGSASTAEEFADWIGFAHLPVMTLVGDRLADALFAVDEVMGMLGQERAGSVRVLESDLRKVYDTLDSLMRKVSD